MLAYANDVSYDDIFVEQLKNFLSPRDLVIGVSGSGNSANVLKAVQYANTVGAATVAFTGFDGGRLAQLAGTSIVVAVHDMQKVEDVHLILTHMIMQYLCRKLNNGGP
jgi:D-sedoheptulose 7-phosphate isomerase